VPPNARLAPQKPLDGFSINLPDVEPQRYPLTHADPHNEVQEDGTNGSDHQGAAEDGLRTAGMPANKS
jgi:hypothetical protein